MRAIAGRGALLAAVVAVSGCANMASIHHVFRPDEGTSVSIDAKQRVVFSVEKLFLDPESGGQKIRYRWRAVCAEPSPDALAAISAASGLSAENLKIALSSAFSLQDGAASIGLRTQTIQLLRDAMYRLCEGYASGALDDISFSRMQRRYQDIMLGLLAIEQLTGAVVAKQAAVTAKGQSHVGSSLLDLNKAIDAETQKKADATKALADANTKKAAADKSLAEAKKLLDDAKKAAGKNANDAKLVEAAEAHKKAEKAAADAAAAEVLRKGELGTATQRVADLEEARTRMAKVAAQGGTGGAFEGGGYSSTINSETAEIISAAVKDIVKHVIDRDYGKETCLTFMLSRHQRVLEPEHQAVASQYCAAILQIEATTAISRAARTPAEAKAATDRQQERIGSQTKALEDAIKALGQMKPKAEEKK